MKNQEKVMTKAEQDYALAYEEHYTTKNLKEAIGLYRKVIDSYPESQEALFAQQQIANIAASVVSKQDMFDAQVKMVLARL